jgi:hypothetical protein
VEVAKASPRLEVVEAAAGLAPLPALAVAVKPSSTVLRAINKPDRTVPEAVMVGAGEGVTVRLLRGVSTLM